MFLELYLTIYTLFMVLKTRGKIMHIKMEGVLKFLFQVHIKECYILYMILDFYHRDIFFFLLNVTLQSREF